jgi:hypothetical protein
MDDEIQANPPERRSQEIQAEPPLAQGGSSEQDNPFKNPSSDSTKLSPRGAFGLGLLLVSLSTPCIGFGTFFLAWGIAAELWGGYFADNSGGLVELLNLVILVLRVVGLYVVPALITLAWLRDQPNTCRQMLYYLTAFNLAFNVGIFVLIFRSPLP